MGVSTDIEATLLALPAHERERLAVSMWGSLVCDPDAAGDAKIDSEGIGIADARDSELSEGRVEVLNSEEFRRLTGGDG